jgi:hypothetical protein
MADFDDDEVEDLDAEENVDEVEETENADELEEGFKESIDDDDIDEFDDDVDEDLKVVDEVLNHKDQNARALAIRRALEERAEARRISEDLDYLDFDIDD